MPDTRTPAPKPLPDPAAGGAWLRNADGSLSPADEITATRAGLPWPPASQTPEKE